MNAATATTSTPATIASRRTAAPEQSYVAQLNARGLPVMARKLGEEAVEAAILEQQRALGFAFAALLPQLFDAPLAVGDGARQRARFLRIRLKLS